MIYDLHWDIHPISYISKFLLQEGECLKASFDGWVLS